MWKTTFWLSKWKLKVTQSCPTLQCHECSPPGSSVHGILQARILERVAISFSRSSWLRDWTRVSRVAGRLHQLSHQVWWKSTYQPHWTHLVLISLRCILGLCHSFKCCALSPSLLFQFCKNETEWSPMGLPGTEAFFVPHFLQTRLQSPCYFLSSQRQIQTVDN